MEGKLTVVIPVYNECGTVEEVLKRVAKAPLRKEVIVVDDGSDDGSREILERLSGNAGPPDELRIFFHARNRGKGAAVRTGIARATGDWILIQDADLEYDPRDYPLLLAPLLDGRADVVYGSRFLDGAHRTRYLQHYLANRFLTFVSNLMTNQNLSDMETGYKVFRREVIQQVRIEEDRFGFEPEITAKLVKLPGIRVYEVGVSYAGRTFEDGKKIDWRDGLHAVWCIVKYNLLR
jgi:glycosyltransferase involved in cell wall biosynthesis